MILRIEDLKSICSTILAAVDSSDVSRITETLEIKVKNNILYLNVTNREYYARVKINIDENINFHATVNAMLFLNLIAQTTTDTVELNTTDKELEFIGNGTYHLPFIFDGDNLLESPEINIDDSSIQFRVDSEIFKSILKYNSKELSKGVISRPVQRLYYVDENGCITFTSGACVNNFTLPQPVKFLLNSRIVKLFKLFKEPDVLFSYCHGTLDSGVDQTKVKFETSSIEITAILSDDSSLVNTVPVEAIRSRANYIYPYSISLSKDVLIQTINRLSLFNTNSLKSYSLFEFKSDSFDIYDVNKINKESIYYNNSIDIDDTYKAYIDFSDLKITLDSLTDQYITINFGDHSAIVISQGNIKSVIPECQE